MDGISANSLLILLLIFYGGAMGELWGRVGRYEELRRMNGGA